MSLRPERVLIDRATIQAKVAEMARTIEARHRHPEPLLVVSVLRGAVIFAADLMRELNLALSVEFVAVESYGSSTRSSGAVNITRDVTEDLDGRHVLLVEDIVDTGLTLRYLISHLKGKNPASLEVAVLLDKVARRQIEVKVDYTGFVIPDAFVVGYGLDYAGLYRNLPDVMVLGESAS